jgi:outer membrane immunogenic protein
MKRSLLAGVAIGALMSVANAADLPRKAPVMAPAPLPVLSWTGCYVGGQVGGGWGKNDVTQNAAASSLGTTVFSGRATTGVDTSGAVFGGQVGCDYQFANNFVIGIQGMLAGTSIKGTEYDAMNGLLAGFGVSGGTIGVKTKWLGSVTGRLGYSFLSQNEGLIYVKGGGAWARYETNLANIATNILLPGTAPGTVDNTFGGWTVGGGFEYRFARNWSAFIEYNYYDFSEKTIFAGNGFACGPVGCASYSTSIDMKPKLQTVTVGVNYRFWTP